MKSTAFLPLTMIAALASWGSSQAASLYNMDWGKNPDPVYNGAAVVGSAGDIWNQVDPESNINGPGPIGTGGNFALVDSTGASSGLTVAWSDDLQSSANPGNLNFTTLGLNDLYLTYGFTGPGTTATVTISGLTPGDTYDLYLFGFPDGTGQDVTFASGGTTAPTLSGANRGTNPGALVNDVHYSTFSGTVDGTGSITYTQTGSSFSGSAGFQLDVVPEPSSLSLLGFGALLAFRRRR